MKLVMVKNASDCMVAPWWPSITLTIPFVPAEKTRYYAEYIFLVVSSFLLNFISYLGNLDYFLESVSWVVFDCPSDAKFLTCAPLYLC